MKDRQPDNTSSVVNVELLNDSNQVVLSYSTGTWSESGIWCESGESGYWREQATTLMSEFRPVQTGQFRLRLSLEDLIISRRSANALLMPAKSTVGVVAEVYTNAFNPGLRFESVLFC